MPSISSQGTPNLYSPSSLVAFLRTAFLLPSAGFSFTLYVVPLNCVIVALSPLAEVMADVADTIIESSVDDTIAASPLHTSVN